ncbi:MAG: aromatic ring-hydroxylating dioxygenase subunit alpha [Gammaproteobacteria bacterium]|jgi:phenylpropionate dioxygenase-like ring-hydroxylating dioxygenase large terminal subunit|nr:aromatic ring-hydroxylating dioxygenase subunit alpha [Gammaproteobacteria bacterium]MBT5201849.1 aromatic ring-hydroxylating dioxygenase subunit alpha [Gammaproteobacteria bacterium]MBT5600750.1 aromatic ring-hydroxylating dioxygenase subunit alpha [Gammaproteobacteria bacterium]MBT6244197.1 aromatic ring-hydroxylating dioxygenase subunit alpha [Gammaproteobacteria bacterium]
MFLHNAWYIAAWASEVERQLVHRTLLGEPVVLYRKRDGSAVALEDACPHRKLPLSMGILKDDLIQCGYHGLEFDCSGRCVNIPGQEKISPDARVKSYPVVERWNLLWVWMGEAGSENTDDIIEIPHYTDSHWGINRGPAMSIDCDYRYMTDNLVDPSHVSYVHKSSLGNEDSIGIPVKTREEDNSVIVSRWILNAELAPFFQPYMKFSGKADRLQHYEVRLPSSAVIKDVIAPAGSGAPEGKIHPDSFLLDSYNFVTPVSADSCRYYWFQVRNFDAQDKAVSSSLTEAFMTAFNEDVQVLEAVHSGIKNSRSELIHLQIDSGSARLRRLLNKMLSQEQPIGDRQS